MMLHLHSVRGRHLVIAAIIAICIGGPIVEMFDEWDDTLQTGNDTVQQHLGYKAGIPTYVFGSYVAMSRLHDNRHHPSDVVFGAALGIVIGRAVTFHGRNFWGGPTFVPTRGGFAAMFTKPHAGS
jgi:membrane-associated phospholipid phosphatase